MQENILFLIIVFVVTGTGQRYVPLVKPEEYDDSSVMRAQLASISATNSSSLKEIMQEMGTRMEIQKIAGCKFPAGTFGGGGGDVFSEILDNCGAVIQRIEIRSGGVIDSIQITYRLSSGKCYTGDLHGGAGGQLHTIDIDVVRGERIIDVFGKSGALVDQLGFITNQGRIFGPYGGSGGKTSMSTAVMFEACMEDLAPS